MTPVASTIPGKHETDRTKLENSFAHMASLTAVKLDADLKAYYERKVGEGKNKMSVLNSVKCKLLAGVVAVVNKGEEHVRKAA